jgi:energy-converting hydrogenase Eha subunit F
VTELPPARPRPRILRRVLPVLVALVLLGLGIALGEALHDNPQPGGTQTQVRTLRPLPLAPAARSTVTRTVPAR